VPTCSYTRAYVAAHPDLRALTSGA